MFTLLSLGVLTACASTVKTSTHKDDASVLNRAKPNAQWQLVWSDEFDGDTIDTRKWNYDIDCWGGGNNEKQCYTNASKNAAVSQGLLTLTAHKGPSSGPRLPLHLRTTENARDAVKTQPYTSARLTTKGKGDWRYGRVDVRAKLPGGQGVWPAIWMLPTDNVYGTWAASGEIDIMEAVNLGTSCPSCIGEVENEILGTLHYGDKWPKNTLKSETTTLDSATTEFHTYTVQWSEGRIRWLIDGQPYGTQTSKTWRSHSKIKGKPHAPFDEKFHLILNLAIGGKWPEGDNGGGVDPTGFPKSMQIDWVRVYQCPDDLQTAKACVPQ